MAMTFAERMALRKKEAELGKVTTPLAVEETPKPSEVEGQPITADPVASKEVASKEESQCVRKWGKKFGQTPVTLDNSSASNPSPTLSDKLNAQLREVNTPQPVQANKMESFPLTKIITMNNIAGQAAPTEGELLLAGDMPEDAIRIKQRISMLSQVEDGTLKSEMDELKKLIKAAPEACQFLLPEELGQVVRALRSMTDNKLAVDLGRAKPRKTKKDEMPKLTAADLKDLEF